MSLPTTITTEHVQSQLADLRKKSASTKRVGRPLPGFQNARVKSFDSGVVSKGPSAGNMYIKITYAYVDETGNETSTLASQFLNIPWETPVDVLTAAEIARDLPGGSLVAAYQARKDSGKSFVPRNFMGWATFAEVMGADDVPPNVYFKDGVNYHATTNEVVDQATKETMTAARAKFGTEFANSLFNKVFSAKTEGNVFAETGLEGTDVVVEWTYSKDDKYNNINRVFATLPEGETIAGVSN